MKKNTTFWGLIFIFISLTIIAQITGFIQAYSIVRLIWTIILGAFAISRIVSFNFIPASIAAAIAVSINADYLNINASSGLIFLASILLGVGLTLLTKGSRRKKYKDKVFTINGKDIHINRGSNKSFNSSSQNIEGEHVYVENNFGDNSRYILSDNLKTARIENNLGHSRVYFDNVTFNSESSVVNAECNLGKITLYFPSNINLQNNLKAQLGSIRGAGSFHTDDAYPTVFLEGESNLGDIEVIIL